MGATHDRQGPRVKLLAAILFREPAALAESLTRLAAAFSPPDFQGPPHPFTQTDYYRAEMGSGLSRCLVGFSRLVTPQSLPAAKHASAEVEKALTKGGGRSANIDVGYLDLFKVVLASFKARGNKLYLERGVWADMTLYFERGRFHPLPWSFPDFREGAYDDDLHQIRELYKGQLRTTEGKN